MFEFIIFFKKKTFILYLIHFNDHVVFIQGEIFLVKELLYKTVHSYVYIYVSMCVSVCLCYKTVITKINKLSN